jgi:hypothetical protein
MFFAASAFCSDLTPRGFAAVPPDVRKAYGLPKESISKWGYAPRKGVAQIIGGA